MPVKTKKLDLDHYQKIDERVQKEYPGKEPVNLMEILSRPGFKTTPKKKKNKRSGKV